MNIRAANALTRKDFQTDQDVRWCPGCGDYSILAAVQKVFPTLGIPREKFAVVSGIGCSGRFPYYMNTYGFHTLHGRAFAVATGLKAANPELSVWVVTGDGDSMSIGGNHFMHVVRRNVNLKILIFNNQIYGLTKGQYSPTSEVGKKTKSTPMGSIDSPVHPLSFALGVGASFVARTVDREPKHMTEMLNRAAAHEGTAIVEIYQNCNIFNDGAFETLTDRASKKENQLILKHGQPLVFGPQGENAIIHEGFELKVVSRDSVDDSQIVRHDETAPIGYHKLLSLLEHPTPLGVFRAVEAPVYDQLLHEQVANAEADDKRSLQSIIEGPDTWTVE